MLQEVTMVSKNDESIIDLSHHLKATAMEGDLEKPAERSQGYFISRSFCYALGGFITLTLVTLAFQAFIRQIDVESCGPILHRRHLAHAGSGSGESLEKSENPSEPKNSSESGGDHPEKGTITDAQSSSTDAQSTAGVVKSDDYHEWFNKATKAADWGSPLLCTVPPLVILGVVWGIYGDTAHEEDIRGGTLTAGIWVTAFFITFWILIILWKDNLKLELGLNKYMIAASTCILGFGFTAMVDMLLTADCLKDTSEIYSKWGFDDLTAENATGKVTPSALIPLAICAGLVLLMWLIYGGVNKIRHPQRGWCREF